MDLNKLTDISAWDVRNVYNKVKNVVMNYSEMEIKVNEATNSDPWGASSTLMRELADATHNRKDFDDIMPMIYVKINDMDPANWRQVYKALQLVEYLVKNGSGRVVDDVRGHLTIIKTLKNFHHIDSNGKDQGINVRHRSKELVDLVNDNERLRSERKKAKENRNKYSGFSGGSRMDGFGNSSMGSSNSGRGGFGNSSGIAGGFGLGSSSRYGGLSSSDFMASSRYDDRSDSTSNYRSESSTPSASSKLASRKSTRQETPKASKPAEPEVADLFSFDDDTAASSNPPASAAPVISSSTSATANIMDSLAIPAPAPAPATSTKSATVDLLSVSATNNEDDEWGDFQGIGSSANAPVGGSTPAISQLKPMAGVTPKANSSSATMDLLGDGNTGLNFQTLPVSSPVSSQTTASTKPSDAKKAKGAFSDIWDVNSDILSLDSLSLTNKKSETNKKSLNQLANQI
ncbi:Epsin-3, clathrin recruitment and traffic between the Golgi and endosome [Coemansia brasiliensis]|uniref:Epsin-3, clathrin recruitment and traffic between the Golgi and endosome n=1 Tax=Coemansia brasiliensis TaxID=2650707 RepID=A0A9W8IAR4_9FUNG|nr:Epsin-3, clathrin recruitment and traffic between the Golgi and endosome [Coemansia brasiliensis]